MKVTKNVDLDKYGYSCYGIRFDSRSPFSWSDCSWRKNVIIFGADMSSPVHFDNKKKDILVLGEGPTQGLYNNTTITAEAHYLFNFTKSGKRFVLSLYYNGRNSFLFINDRKIYQFKAKDSEI